MKGAINLRGVFLMPGSHAHKLHQDGELDKLKRHMKELDAKQHALEGVVTSTAWSIGTSSVTHD